MERIPVYLLDQVKKFVSLQGSDKDMNTTSSFRQEIMKWETEEELYMGWVCDWGPANSWLKPSLVPVQFLTSLDIKFTSLHSQMENYNLSQ